MTDDTDRIESPCVRNCCLNLDDICLGCFRSLSEIIAWGQASNEERKTILSGAEKRAIDIGSNYNFLQNPNNLKPR